MKRFLPAIPFALVFAAVVAYGQYSSYTRNLQVWATGLIANITNFFGANRTNLLREIPEIAGALQKSGGTVTGEVAIIGNGVGQFGVGSTNNPVSPLVVMAYDGNQFEMGGGSGGLGGPLSVGFPWLTVADGVAASWSIPMSAPSFSGSFIGDGAGLSNITIPPEIAMTNVVSKSGDTMTGSLMIVASGGIGWFALGSTNNAEAPLVGFSYSGGLFEFGDAFPDTEAVNHQWLVIPDGLSADWLIPLTAPSFTGAHAGDGSAVTNLNAGELRSGTVPVERLASNLQALSTNGVSGPLTLSATEAPGSSNRIAATTEFVAKAVYGLSGGGGTGNASTNLEQGWSSRQTFAAGIDAPGTNNLGILHVVSIQPDVALDQSVGGTGGTNAETARIALGLDPDVDVQAYHLALKQFALAILASGDVPYMNSGGIVTNAPSTTFGRSLWNGVDAAAVRALLSAVYLGGDTMTGPLLVPYIGSVSGHTNVGSNQVATLRALAEVEARVTAGGLISAVDTNLEINATVLGITNFNAGATGPIIRQSDLDTGTLNWTNATSLAIPAGNDPTTDAAGEIALDRNGDFLELYVNSAAESRVIPTLHKCSATIIDPDGIQAVEDAIPLLPVESTWAPHGITIKDIYVKIDAAVSYAVTLEEWTDPATASSDIETVTVSSGTEAEDDGTLSDASVAAGSIVFVDLPTTAANFLTVTFTYIINPGN